MDEYISDFTLTHFGYVRSPHFVMYLYIREFFDACNSRTFREYYLCPGRIEIKVIDAIYVIKKASVDVFKHISKVFNRKFMWLRLLEIDHENETYIMCRDKWDGCGITTIKDVSDDELIKRDFVSHYSLKSDLVIWKLRKSKSDISD